MRYSNIQYLNEDFKVVSKQQDICYVRKTLKPSKRRRWNFVPREKMWLEKLADWDRTPDLISCEKYSVILTYVGKPINASNIPDDWEEQAKDIISGLIKYNCSHNDIYNEEILVKDGKIYLIDFHHATMLRENMSKKELQKFKIHFRVKETDEERIMNICQNAWRAKHD